MTSESLPNYDAATVSWLDEFGLTPPVSEHPDWGFKLSFSTVPPFDWTIRRSKVRSNDLWFSIGLSRVLGWTTVLFPRDEAFNLTWRQGGKAELSSRSALRYFQMRWPRMQNPGELPQVLVSVEELLQVKFHRTAEFYGPTLKSEDFQRLAEWLRPVCDEIVFRLGTVYGPLPANAEIEDDRETGGGVSVTLKLAP